MSRIKRKQFRAIVFLVETITENGKTFGSLFTNKLIMSLFTRKSGHFCLKLYHTDTYDLFDATFWPIFMVDLSQEKKNHSERDHDKG